MHAIIIYAVLLLTATTQAGTCYSDKGCKEGCCEQSGLGAPCWCSACCLAKDVPDEIAYIYRDARRAAFVFRHRVEFHDLNGLRPALIAKDGAANPLNDGAPARGRPALIDRSGKIMRSSPRTTLRFKEGIYPAETRMAGSSAFIVCTSTEWGVVSSTAAHEGFCGALRLDGRQIFRLDPERNSEVLLEPIGLAADAREALFALTKKRSDGAREIVGYRVWKKGRPAETLATDGPRVQSLIEKYEGPFVLPSQRRGSAGQ